MSNTLSFPNMFNKNKYMLNSSLSYNIKSINESLKSLFLTSKGELFGDPNYGTTIKEMIFSLKNSINILIIKQMILSTIEKYETRILTSLDNIKIYSNSNDEQYKIVITYKVKNTDKLNNVEIILENN